MEYVNDIRSNYLVEECFSDIDEFQLQMLTKNQIRKLLPVEVRYLDGKMLLYYNVSGKLSLETLFMDKMIGLEHFQKLIWDMQEVFAHAKDYFLPEKGILLSEKYIFWDLETKEYVFLYSLQQENVSFQELADYLLQKINHKEDELVDVAYRFCEDAYAGGVVLEKYLDEALPQECHAIQEERQGFEEEPKEQSEKPIISRQISAQEYPIDLETADEPKEVYGKRKEKGECGRLVPYIVAVIGIVAAVILCTFSARFLYLICGGGIATLIVLCAKKTFRIKNNEEDDEIEEKSFYYINTNEYEALDIKEAENSQKDERTVYMDLPDRLERKLYGTGKYRNVKIDLKELPLSVGKDPAMAAFVLEDISVSRLHARFTWEENHVWMQDQNSTNGIIHNGMKLRPNQKVMLESEDEIAIGRVTFVFR